MSAFYNSPFHMLNALSSVPFGSNVYVVSDTQYQEFKRDEAQKEIDILSNRAAAYRKTALLIEEEINQIKKDVGLLPASESSEKTDD